MWDVPFAHTRQRTVARKFSEGAKRKKETKAGAAAFENNNVSVFLPFFYQKFENVAEEIKFIEEAVFSNPVSVTVDITVGDFLNIIGRAFAEGVIDDGDLIARLD